MTHSHWINTNYKFLYKWSRAWSHSDWSDLLNHYVEYLDTNWQKFSNIPDNDERLKFSNQWFKNQTRWHNSDFNRKHKVNDLSGDWSIPDMCEDHFLELKCESDREDISLWLVDIHNQFGEEGARKLIKVREIYLTLDTHERVLYDMYFTHMNTMREISDKLSIPLTSVFKMVGELKIKLTQ